MGTIGNQPERNNFEPISPRTFIYNINNVQDDPVYPVSDKDMIEAAKVLQMVRANDIAVQDGNYRDEHMAGIAEYLERIATALETIAEKMS